MYRKYVNMFTKHHELINQGKRPHPFLNTLTSNTVSRIFWHMRLLFFLHGDKVRKEKRIELSAKKRHNFLMRGIVRIRRQSFVSFVGERSDNIGLQISANLVQGRPTWNSKCTYNSRKIRWHPSAMRLSHQG